MRIPNTVTCKLQSMLKEFKATDGRREETNKEMNKTDSLMEGKSSSDNDQMEVDNQQDGCVTNNGGNVLSIERRLVLPGDDSNEWDPVFMNKVGEGYLKVFRYLEGMEARLFDAHLPVEVCVSIMCYLHVDLLKISLFIITF